MIGAELQKAIFDALNEVPAVADGRIYDRVPASPVFPYITIGDEQVIDDGNACDDGWEVFADIHVWSRPANGSKAEVKALAASAVTRLRTISSVAGFTVIVAAIESSQTRSDPDGITEHAVIIMRYVLNPA